MENKPCLLKRKSFAQDANTRKGDHATGKCTGLGRDKDGNPNCVCEGFLFDIGAASDSIVSSQ